MTKIDIRWRNWLCSCAAAVTMIAASATIPGCGGGDSGPSPVPTATATPVAANADLTGTYNLNDGSETGTVLLRDVARNGTARGTVASPVLQQPAPITVTVTNGQLSGQSEARPDRNGRPTVYVVRGIVITINNSFNLQSGSVEKRQNGAIVASGRLATAPVPAVNPFAGTGNGTLTVTQGSGVGQTGIFRPTVSRQGALSATVTVPNAGGSISVAISGVVDASNGQLIATGTNSSTSSGTLILALSGRLSAAGGGSGTFQLRRAQGGSTTVVNAGTFRVGSGTPNPTATASGTPRPTSTPGGSATPTPTVRPGATATPTTRPGATPTPIPPATGSIVTFFTAEGTFNTATGQFTQDASDADFPSGEFRRVRVIASTLPTPTPGPTPTAEPEPTPDGSIGYLGSYTLSNGERGLFVLSVDAPSTPRTASGIGLPRLGERQTLDFLNPIQTGTTTITLRVSGSTGSGRVTLSNGVTGVITIEQRFTNSRRASRNLPQTMRMKLTMKRR